MKKIIIAICGMFVVSGAMASREIIKPKSNTTSQIRAHWGANTSNGFGVSVVDKFAPKWQFNTKAGTYGTNNEGSIVGIVARDIWEHGGNFCTTQIQAAWSWVDVLNNRYWIDYYDSPEKYMCKKICESGYSGEKCETKSYDCIDTANYLTGLNDVQDSSLRLLSGKQNGNITNKMDVLGFSNGMGGKDSYHIVLGVIERKEHSVLVAPIRIDANDNKIISAYSGDKTFVLCAPGYKLNAKEDDCEPAPECDPSNIASQDWCTSWKEPENNADQYKLVSINGCKQYRCKNENYGFETWPNKKCVSCGTGKKFERYGVNNLGACLDCDGENELFSREEKRCVRMKKITKEKMRDCFMKTDPDEFKSCVNE
ncbi:MAG: hypothetical protein J5714_04340 [Alphaproteobacteria bacterium]|nr:hypothetical protein [Alphaproteobacteria bacterium]